MAVVTTLPMILQPMMGKPDVLSTDHTCAFCGRHASPGVRIEKHHIVRRGAGEMYVDGEKLRKPLISVCGDGNALKDADGRFLCHGLIHNHMLHLRWNDGCWEFLMTSEPTKYIDALCMNGWRRLRTFSPQYVFGRGA